MLALEELERINGVKDPEGRGTDFDPDVADVFLSLRSEVEKVHEALTGGERLTKK